MELMSYDSNRLLILISLYLGCVLNSCFPLSLLCYSFSVVTVLTLSHDIDGCT